MCNSNLEIKRGEICFIDLPQVEGNIQYGLKPCVIWSSDINNKFAPILNVIPITSRLRKVYPMHVLIGRECGLEKDSYVLPEQITTVMKNRVKYKVGYCDEFTLKRIEEGLNIQAGKDINNRRQSNDNKFSYDRVKQMTQSIYELESFIILYGMKKEIWQSIELQIHILKQYCREYHEDVNMYYKSRIKPNEGVIKYA